MNRESATYDESERVEKMMQDADAFALIRNTVLLNNLNNFFAFCFDELRDLSVEGFDNLYVAVNKYFDCLEKTAVLVRDKRPAFRREFTDIVCEQIDILYRGTRNTGCDHIFLKRLGIKDDFYSDDTIREEVERLIGHGTNDDKFSLFEEDTATDRLFYPNLIELEKQRVQFEKQDDLFDSFKTEEVFSNSVMPSSLDMKERIDVKDVSGVLSNIRWKLAIAAGALITIGGAGVLAQQFTGLEKTDPTASKKKNENVNQEKGLMSPVSNASILVDEQPVGKRKDVFVTCRVDHNSKLFNDYLAKLEDGSPRVFISNFKHAADRTEVETSTADVESIKRDLFNVFLSEMSVYVDDRLTQQFVDVHSLNFKSFNGDKWQDGAGQTRMIYNAIEPDCE